MYPITFGQKKYLALIFQIDQASEKDAKQSWFKGEERCPASEWRWMFYGDLNLMESISKVCSETLDTLTQALAARQGA